MSAGNVYQANGFKDRADYLNSLCQEYPRAAVMALADVLGPNEDVDALITELEDNADEFMEELMRAPSFYVAEVREGAVFIVDRDDDQTRPSVTNAAEDVVQSIIAEHGAERRIFYRDTMQRWDELMHDGHKFTGFKCGTVGFVPPSI